MVILVYAAVLERGGYYVVTKHRLWKAIGISMNMPGTMTSASYTLRVNYEQFLGSFELHYLEIIPQMEALVVGGEFPLDNIYHKVNDHSQSIIIEETQDSACTDELTTPAETNWEGHIELNSFAYSTLLSLLSE